MSRTDRNWVVVLGAGPSQVPYLRQLKEWGYKIFATDRNPDAPGFLLADRIAVISTYDSEGTWNEVKSRLELSSVSSVITPTTGEPLRTAQNLARKIGLPSLDEESVEDLLHKGRLRARLNKTASRPLQWGAGSTLEELQRVAKVVGFPAIVKPARGGMGGRGVSRIDGSVEIEPAFFTARSTGLSSEVVIEQFIEGQELSVTGLLYKGELKFFVVGLSIFDLNTLSLPVGEVIGPDVLPAPVERDVRQAALAACRAFGLETCPLNIDIIFDADRVPHIIEIEFALSDALLLAPIACGYDLRLNELRVDMHLEPETQGLFDYCSAIRFFAHRAPKAKQVDGVDRALSLPNVVELQVDEQARVTYHQAGREVYMWGHVVTRGPNPQKAVALTEKVKKTLHFTY
jgi:biotin carboxylase